MSDFKAKMHQIRFRGRGGVPPSSLPFPPVKKSWIRAWSCSLHLSGCVIINCRSMLSCCATSKILWIKVEKNDVLCVFHVEDHDTSLLSIWWSETCFLHCSTEVVLLTLQKWGAPWCHDKCGEALLIITSSRFTQLSEMIFSALLGMPARTTDEKAVRLSVRPSVCLSNACIVTKRNKDLPDFYTIRKII